ncbi:hypothetical protein DFH28DRAFT_264836 [Melampsora americana]|nr:hypothetical protein DFH28DRAFT_264836 [Melampsora americana]
MTWIYERWDSESGGFNGHPNVDLRISEHHKPINPYTALDVPTLLEFVFGRQRYNGSFGPFPSSTEQEVRFVYCATEIHRKMKSNRLKTSRCPNLQAYHTNHCLKMNLSLQAFKGAPVNYSMHVIPFGVQPLYVM